MRHDEAMDRLGERVTLRTQQGDVYAEGTLVACTDEPTVVIVDEEGRKTSWLTRLTD